MIDLRLGDCLEVMKSIPDKSIDAIICDLPYGTTACKWDSVIPFEPLWEQYKRIIKDNGAIVLTAQTPFDKVLGASNLPMLRYEWIWEKEQGTGGMNANKMPLKKHENVLVFYKKLPIYNPQFTDGKPYKMVRNKPNLNSVYGKTGVKNAFVSVNEGKRYPTSILKFNKETGIHPTQKPVALMEYLVKTYTNQGDTVLDNCMGSGTTGVACKNLGRNFIGIEQDANYFDIAKNRIYE
jgi:site-specific DNA-methyltransferase (adenine-specific)